MNRWKWILATTALLVAISGVSMAEEQHGRDRRDNDGYSQTYEHRREDDGFYRGQYGYRDRDGDRDDQGYWSQRRNRDYNRDYNRVYNRRDRDHDRDRD